MITLHHLEYSQSFRILWLLEEIGAPYELKVYKRDAETRLAPAEYKALSPLGTAPVITDENGLVLAESNAVIDYILDMLPESPLRPPTLVLTISPPHCGHSAPSSRVWISQSSGSLL